MQPRLASAVVAALFVTALVAQDQADTRFGAEGEQRIVTLTRQLERGEIADSKPINAEILTWWIENPHLTIDWCAGMLIDAKNKNIRPSIVTQGLFGAGVFLIEHPDEAADAVALHLAGVESALRRYELAVAENRKMRDKHYDDLVARRQDGGLVSWVEEKVRECAEANGD